MEGKRRGPVTLPRSPSTSGPGRAGTRALFRCANRTARGRAEERRDRPVEGARRLEVGEVADPGDQDVAGAGNRIGHEAVDLHAWLVVLADDQAWAPRARAGAAPASRWWAAWPGPPVPCARGHAPGES